MFHELNTEKPCVGVCQYYRQRGMEMPEETAAGQN